MKRGQRQHEHVTITNHGGRFAHLMICVNATTHEVQFYPDGDRDVLYRGLGLAVKALYTHPEALRCAVGQCDETCIHHGPSGGERQLSLVPKNPEKRL